MNNLKEYIIEKLKLNKNIDVLFFDLSDEELIKRCKKVIEDYNKRENQHYNENIIFDKRNNEWRAQLSTTYAWSEPTLAGLYYKLAFWIGDENYYEEVKNWEYDSKTSEFSKR